MNCLMFYQAFSIPEGGFANLPDAELFAESSITAVKGKML